MQFPRELTISFVLGYLHFHIPEASNLMYRLRRRRKLMGYLMRTLEIPNGDKEKYRRLKLPRPCFAIYPLLSPSFVFFKVYSLKLIIGINVGKFLNIPLDRKFIVTRCSEGQESWHCVSTVTLNLELTGLSCSALGINFSLGWKQQHLAFDF